PIPERHPARLHELLPGGDREARDVHLTRTLGQAELAVEARIHDFLERLLGQERPRQLAPDHLEQEYRLRARRVWLPQRRAPHRAVIAAGAAPMAKLDHRAVLRLV